VRCSLHHLIQSAAVPAGCVVPALLQRCTLLLLQVSNLYRSAPDMRTEDGQLLERLGDTFIITGDIYCNSHTNTAARSAAGCAIQVRRAHLTSFDVHAGDATYVTAHNWQLLGASQVWVWKLDMHAEVWHCPHCIVIARCQAWTPAFMLPLLHLQAVDAVVSGQVDSAFAVVRPPGHHAEPADYMGFCFFNNVAVAAHAALRSGIQRVLVVDWDVSGQHDGMSGLVALATCGGPVAPLHLYMVLRWPVSTAVPGA